VSTHFANSLKKTLAARLGLFLGYSLRGYLTVSKNYQERIHESREGYQWSGGRRGR